MKKLLVILVLLLAVAGAAGGGWWYFIGRKQMAAHVPTGPQPPANPIFVPVQAMTLPVIGPKGVQQMVTIVVNVEVDGQPAAQKVQNAMPALVDAYLSKLYGALDRHYVLNDGLLDVQKVKALLQQTSATVLGKGVVYDVLVQAIAQRPV